MSPAFQERRDILVADTPQEYYRNLAIRWAVFGAIVLLILSLILAYSHAQRRMRQGLPLKAYHKWMIPQSQRKRLNPAALQNQFSFYRANTPGYDLEAFPPPVYDANSAPPPTYQPPAGASKVNPAQEYDMPPPGAPPRAATATEANATVGTVGTSPARSVRLPWLSRFQRST
ncbi:hypothetical protein MMC19_001961 [Ptychographa xylographoides]|nr:hypothetical protein [Ptychographa xylographoides]